MTMPAQMLGREVRFTLNGCDRPLLDDMASMRALVVEICDALAVEVRSMHEEHFEPQGVSVVAILAESHAALHTWPEHGSATVDIFSCGAIDPANVLPLVARALRATDTKVTFGERETDTPEGVRRYPRFEQYVLRPTPGGHFAPPIFRRGIGREFLMEPEALAWQDFFASAEYAPPEGQDILLLHPCSWAKPYDMSAFITSLRAVTDKHSRVHRAIISNVGVVPFEYQMNPFFCSYDYSPAGSEWSDEEQQESTALFSRLTADRIGRYLTARAGDYRAIVSLGHPLARGLRLQIQATARAAGLFGFAAPDAATYREAQQESAGNLDIDAPLFMPSTLRHLDERLGALSDHLDRQLTGSRV